MIFATMDGKIISWIKRLIKHRVIPDINGKYTIYCKVMEKRRVADLRTPCWTDEWTMIATGNGEHRR